MRVPCGKRQFADPTPQATTNAPQAHQTTSSPIKPQAPYSDKPSVNILTALLLRHGVTTAVVCPGARNAPIVHDLHAAGIDCHAVTDERSAGFYALGLSLAKKTAEDSGGNGAPVVVCVTSGTALLNLAPAIAEAHFRQCPLIVISADRPLERTGQLDAQTMPQQNALGCFVAMSVDLPETDTAFANRLINEALLRAVQRPSQPVHINVPLCEPLFSFTTKTLPDVRMIRRLANEDNAERVCDEIAERISRAERPMVVVGQMNKSAHVGEFLRAAERHLTIMYEPLSCPWGGQPFDDALAAMTDQTAYMPDFCLYVGGMVVSKRLKTFLRDAPGAETWMVAHDGAVHDTFMNLTALADTSVEAVLGGLAQHMDTQFGERLMSEAHTFKALWNKALESAVLSTADEFSAEGAVRLFEEMMADDKESHVHYANSTAVRLACRYAKRHIQVNRGVNGIEGSLSAAAGYSLSQEAKTFCVIGDLSFFYDSNALWNTEIDGRLRILLLNNGGGAIFRTLPGLAQSDVCDRFVVARHTTSAEGICAAHRIDYIRATDAPSLRSALDRLITANSTRPILVEVML